MELEIIPPHVEDRRVQMLEQENEAMLRDTALEQMIADRRNRLLLEHRLELGKAAHSTSIRQRQSHKGGIAKHQPAKIRNRCTIGINRIPSRTTS